MKSLATAHAGATATAVLAQVPDQLPEIFALRDLFEPELRADPRGRGERLAQMAEMIDKPASQVRKLFDRFKAAGIVGLVDKRKSAQLWQTRTRRSRRLSEADKELVKTWCDKFQRKNEPAIRAMLKAWRTQSIPPELAERGLTVPHTTTAYNPLKQVPFGWSVRNLLRWAPAPVEAKATRSGLSAAKTEVPLVYTTRRHLYVGQFLMFDDMWHDMKVNDLDQRKSGRPLEFHGTDLKSADMFAWGMRTRTEGETKHEGLRLTDFLFVLAHALTATGYHATRGTTLIVENGTAAIPEVVERLLQDHTDGAIKVRRAPMENAAAHAAQWAGRAKGNFKIKASLESLGNLIHNELAALPAQVGMDRDHCPEEMHDGGRFLDQVTGKPLRTFGRDKQNDALLLALAQLPPDQAQWLQWDRCTIQQFRMIVDRVYGVINCRTEHDLEGWDELYVPNGLGGMRKLSPHEVFEHGRRALTPISDDLLMLILAARGLADLVQDGTAAERSVRQGMITLHDGDVSGDVLRFQAAGILPAGEKFLTVLNPFDPTRLFVYDGKDRPLAVLPRIHSVCPSDQEAIHRAAGAKSKILAAELAGVRRRATAEAKIKGDRDAHNASLISGRPTTPEQKAQAATDRERALPLDAFRTSSSSSPVPAYATTTTTDNLDGDL